MIDPTRPMRVAIVGTRGYPSHYGGFETAVRYVAPALADAGWDVVVYGRRGVYLDEESADPRVRSRITNGIESRSFSTLSFGLTAVLDILLRRRVDVALVMNVANGFWLPLLRVGGVRTAVNVDGIEWERAKWGRLAKFVFRAGALLTARTGDVLIADAEAIREYWRSHFSVVPEFIPYGAEEGRPDVAPLGLSDRGYVLVVARFVPENTIKEFFEAVPVIARERDVVIVGSSGYGGELDDAARRLDEQEERVRWLGHVADDTLLHSLWQHAGVYFHGHSVGGTNPALVQAMALGAPTVALDTVYNREVLGEDHDQFVQADAGQIARVVLELSNDPLRQRQVSERAVERAREHYSWSSVCARYESILSGLVRTARRARRSEL